MTKKQEFHLFKFFIAGVKFHQLDTVIDELTLDMVLDLVPEPTNKFDPNAVKIMHNGVMLGYVPKKFSSEVSARIEAGQVVTCKLIEINRTAQPWEKAKVTIRCEKPEPADPKE